MLSQFKPEDESWKVSLDDFNMKLYSEIVTKKTAWYSFYFPVQLAMGLVSQFHWLILKLHALKSRRITIEKEDVEFYYFLQMVLKKKKMTTTFFSQLFMWLVFLQVDIFVHDLFVL